jgi:integrase
VEPPRRDRQIVRALLHAHPDPRDRRRHRSASQRREAEKHDHTRSIPLASLERLWERRDIDLRERTLWRLLYETAARADEVLRLKVEDLDIPGEVGLRQERVDRRGEVDPCCGGEAERWPAAGGCHER